MSRQAAILALASHFPEERVGNDQLAARFEAWSADKIFAKTGIRERRVAAEGEFASDLAVAAAERLFAAGPARPEDVDVLIFCTQSPDYLLPASACLIQDRLGLASTCMAFDVNQGCSGFVYGLALGKSLLESGMGRRALLLNADTYSKYMHPQDHTVVTLFGDAGTATLLGVLEGDAAPSPFLGPFAFGTDGAGAENLILESGACRGRDAPRAPDGPREGGVGYAGHLFMNGPKILQFTLQRIPALVASTLEQAELEADEIDLYVFHQANRFMLDALRRKLRIPEQRMVVELEDTGNTVSCTIPYALERCLADDRLRPGMRLLLVGFGVGYSWGAAVVRWAGTEAPGA